MRLAPCWHGSIRSRDRAEPGRRAAGANQYYALQPWTLQSRNANVKRAPGALTRNRTPPEQPLSSPATRCPAAAHAASGPRRRRSCARHHDAPLALCRAAHAPDQRANAQDAAAAGSGSSDESDDSDEEEVVTRKAMGHEGLMDTVRRPRLRLRAAAPHRSRGPLVAEPLPPAAFALSLRRPIRTRRRSSTR